MCAHKHTHTFKHTYTHVHFQDRSPDNRLKKLEEHILLLPEELSWGDRNTLDSTLCIDVYCAHKMFIGRFSVTNDTNKLDVFDDVLCVAVPLEKCWEQI